MIKNLISRERHECDRMYEISSEYFWCSSCIEFSSVHEKNQAFSNSTNSEWTQVTYGIGDTGVGKCPFLGILNITFKYLLEIISPILGWCLPTPVISTDKHWIFASTASIASSLWHPQWQVWSHACRWPSPTIDTKTSIWTYLGTQKGNTQRHSVVNRSEGICGKHEVTKIGEDMCHMCRRNLVTWCMLLSVESWLLACGCLWFVLPGTRTSSLQSPSAQARPGADARPCEPTKTPKASNGHIFDIYVYIYTHLETLSAFFFAGGKMLLSLRWTLSTDMLKQQNTEKIPTRNYAGIMGNYTAWKHDRLTTSKQPANQIFAARVQKCREASEGAF